MWTDGSTAQTELTVKNDNRKDTKNGGVFWNLADMLERGIGAVSEFATFADHPDPQPVTCSFLQGRLQANRQAASEPYKSIRTSRLVNSGPSSGTDVPLRFPASRGGARWSPRVFGRWHPVF